MIMITGGAFQGKTDYAKKRFGFSDDDILNGESCELDTIFNAKCIRDYQLIVKRLLAENSDPEAFTKQLCKENPNAVVIINEIGSGIIPLEKNERIWREKTGRAGFDVKDVTMTDLVSGRENVSFSYEGQEHGGLHGIAVKIKG